MRIIDDEYALPAPEPFRNGTLGYIRSIADPCYLIAGQSGETFTRRDGAPWSAAGYWIARDGSPDREGKVTREPTTAYGDAGHQPKPVGRRKAS